METDRTPGIQTSIFETARERKPGQNSYNKKILDILEDRRPHSVYEIMEILFPSGKCGTFRLSARIWDLNHLYGHSFRIESYHEQGKWWYVIKDTLDKTLSQIAQDERLEERQGVR